ncbi:aminoglycoside phosphotransferase [Teratosphaeria destructans]|uniref:Aminoglycoside phosphotransferase n=1 Tax=Teratosphaeria destructans TaxID=418781 RepID=A0A9W7VZH6_9PEZI|nr:aminoglycoside phosphotransferase [Teratosphaeria destructans]
MHQPVSDAGRFLFGQLDFRHEAFRAQPNAVHDEEDCRLQMSHHIMLRTLLAKGVERSEGPFALQYTDLHASNLFVDEDWNIVGVIDLEFVCSLPPSMLEVPYWFSAQYIDGLKRCLEEHNRQIEDFLQVFEEEEIRVNSSLPLGKIIRQAWVSGEYWIYNCLTSINAMPHLMEDHIWRRFGFRPSLSEETVFVRNLSHFWSEQSDDFVKQKVCDKKQYNDEVTLLYNSIDL